MPPSKPSLGPFLLALWPCTRFIWRSAAAHAQPNSCSQPQPWPIATCPVLNLNSTNWSPMHIRTPSTPSMICPHFCRALQIYFVRKGQLGTDLYSTRETTSTYISPLVPPQTTIYGLSSSLIATTGTFDSRGFNASLYTYLDIWHNLHHPTDV